MTAAAPPLLPRWLLGIALVLPLTLIGGILLAATLIRAEPPAPLPLAAVAAPAAGSADCAHLLGALPPKLEGDGNESVRRRDLAAPVPPGTAGWGEPPVVVRCGLGRPAALTVTARLLDISGVQFLALPAPDRPDGAEASSWVAVDRPVYVVVSLPPDVGSGPLQQIAGVIRQTLPPRDLDLSP